MRTLAMIFGWLLILFGGGCALYMSMNGGYIRELNSEFGGLVCMLTIGPMALGLLIVGLELFSRGGKQ